jgi:hypothetical protein
LAVAVAEVATLYVQDVVVVAAAAEEHPKVHRVAATVIDPVSSEHRMAATGP